jgi:hypothetical protein
MNAMFGGQHVHRPTGPGPVTRASLPHRPEVALDNAAPEVTSCPALRQQHRAQRECDEASI